MVTLRILDEAKRFVPGTLQQRIKQSAIVQNFYDRLIMTKNFQSRFGRKPNLRNPRTFNEKVVFKMLHDRRPLLTRLSDKVRVREFIAETIGTEYLTVAYQICDTASEINWQRLPQRFVIKASHGSGMNIFVSDRHRLNVVEVGEILESWLRQNFYFHLREWAYRDIKPAILIEENLFDAAGKPPIDWKFLTFDGRVALLQVDLDRFGDHTRNLYDRQLKRLSARSTYPSAKADPEFPRGIEKMFSIAEKLGRGLDFVRVDLYSVDGRILVGELTSYPAAGLELYDPPEFELALGDEWQLPPKYV